MVQAITVEAYDEQEEYWESLAESMLDQPAEGDYILSPCGYLGGKTLVSIVGERRTRSFDDEDTALYFIEAQMQREGFWPNIWRGSDHGNLTLVSI